MPSPRGLTTQSAIFPNTFEKYVWTFKVIYPTSHTKPINDQWSDQLSVNFHAASVIGLWIEFLSDWFIDCYRGGILSKMARPLMPH